MSISDEDVSDQRVKEKINDLRTKYPDIHRHPGTDSNHGYKRSH